MNIYKAMVVDRFQRHLRMWERTESPDGQEMIYFLAGFNIFRIERVSSGFASVNEIQKCPIIKIIEKNTLNEYW